MEYSIREAERRDVDDILMMIKELAEYLQCDDQVQITKEALLQDGFGKDRCFHCLVAEQKHQGITEVSSQTLVGYAIYIYTYSTWEGRMLYMEDLYVSPICRGHGVGSKLWKTVASEGLKKKCTRMQWVVSNKSTSSIEYYKRKGAEDLTLKEGWHMFRMDQSTLANFASSLWTSKSGLTMEHIETRG